MEHATIYLPDEQWEELEALAANREGGELPPVVLYVIEHLLMWKEP